jgi:hypothetical protein
VAPSNLAWPPRGIGLVQQHASPRPGPRLGRSDPSGVHGSSPPRPVTACWLNVVCSILVRGLNRYVGVPVPHGTDGRYDP